MFILWFLWLMVLLIHVVLIIIISINNTSGLMHYIPFFPSSLSQSWKFTLNFKSNNINTMILYALFLKNKKLLF